ncbi:MAG: dihydrofolate reductase [Anaerolineales bacterium]|nr:dihydrofolate reductase [Anaerolineales bacterium]
MILSLIVAADEGNGIGIGKSIPWHLRDDLINFRRLTTGHHLLFGRKTWQTINRPLLGRKILVMSRDPSFSAPAYVEVVHLLPDAINLAETRGEDELFIAGGGELYQQTLPLASRIYFTRVHTVLPVDTYFPPLETSEWEKFSESSHPADGNNSYPFTFTILQRIIKEVD